MRRFFHLLRERWSVANTFVCVGLDPIVDRFPLSVRSDADPVFAFNRAIVDATAEFACAFKPQIAHYSALGAEASLERTIRYIKETQPLIPVILDAKRGDIGSTAEQYANEVFDRYGADAVTVNPWLGQDSIEPFLRREGKGVVVLCRTSNAGAADFQDLMVGGEPIYLHVARRVAEEWNHDKNCMLVVGATAPESIREVRNAAPDVPFLVPGVGAQGGDVSAVVRNGITGDGFGLVINSSRAILYADGGDRFADTAGTAAKALRDVINRHRPPALVAKGR